jgi:hypothetical protein
MIKDNHFGKTFLFLKNLILITLKSKAKHFRMINKVKILQILINK